MLYRRFGRTDLQVPAITFGGGWVGGVLIHKDRSTAFAALDRATAAGIDWIDTAAMYGNGVSETVIGEWLRARTGQPRPHISTKFRPDPAAGDLAGQVRRSVEASHKRLGLDRVEVLILHNQLSATGGDGTFRPTDLLKEGGVADIMDGLRADGLCDHLGLSALGEPAAIKEVVASGRFDVAQVYYNAINPTAAWTPPTAWNTTRFDGLLAACQGHDMGVMAIRIFAAGHLASTERHGREVPITANSGDAAEAARAAVVWQALGDRFGTPAQASLRFGLGCEQLSTIVVGMAELDHLEQALATEKAGPLPAAALADLEQAWRSHPAFTG